MPVPPPGRKEFSHGLIIVEHLGLFPGGIKAGSVDADLLDGQSPGILCAGIEKQTFFCPAKSHSQVGPHGLPHDPARGRMYAAGHIHRQFKSLPAVHLLDDLRIFSLYLPGQPYTEKGIHHYSIFLTGPIADHPHRIIADNFILSLPLPGTVPGRACLIDCHLPVLQGQYPGHSQAIRSIVAAARHHQEPFFLCPQMSVRGIGADLLRHGKSRSLHQRQRRHAHSFYDGLLKKLHLPGVYHIFHSLPLSCLS